MIVALCTVLALLAVPSHAQGSQGSTPTSPCPNVFLYDSPGSEPGMWSGVVTLSTDILLHSTSLNIVLDSHAANLVNWIGHVNTLDGLDFVIENEEMQIHPGQPVLVPFYIQYDPLNTIPRLRQITLNGKVICNADTQQRGTVGEQDVSLFSTAPAFNPNRFSNTPEPPAECGVVGINTVPLIRNGDAYDRGELPWLVAIYNNQMGALKFTCGGTLVSDRHIISAAHCVQSPRKLTSFKDIVVKLGVQNLNDWADDETVTRGLRTGYVHEDFNVTSLENNILILTLQDRVKFNLVIRPACLWAGSTDLSVIVGRSGTVAGWGDQGVGSAGDRGEPHKVHIPIASTEDCRASNPLFHQLTNDNTLCAGDRKGSGPCVGDSGGGLYVYADGRWRIRGVVSVSLRPENGEDTCNLNEYVVFTDTAKFLPWINRIMAQD